MTVAATFSATLVDEWVRAGLTDAVMAPGSRSTPLAVALVRDGRIALHVRLDERSAAFFAVGIGLATGRPAVLVTTSGTAAVEVHAAVVEAHQARCRSSSVRPIAPRSSITSARRRPSSRRRSSSERSAGPSIPACPTRRPGRAGGRSGAGLSLRRSPARWGRARCTQTSHFASPC